MKKILFIFLFLTGCATTQPETITVTQEVKVPVPVLCEFVYPKKPEPSALPDNTMDKIVHILKELEAYMNYSTELDILLKSCSKEKI